MMYTGQKRKSYAAFFITFTVCLFMFIGQVFAADLQKHDDSTTEIVTADSEDMLENNTDPESGDDVTTELTDSLESAVQEEQKDIPDEKSPAFLQDTDAADTIIISENEVSSEEVTEVSEESIQALEKNNVEGILPSSLEEKTRALASSETEEPTETVLPYDRPLKDGTYVIVPKINSFMALQAEGSSTAAGKQVELHDCDGSNAQKYKLVGDAQTGYYSITNVQSGKNLAVKGDAEDEGTPVVQNTASATLGQKWILVQKDGYYMIQSALDGTPLSLTLKNGSVVNGTDVVLEEVKETASQLFSFLVSKPSVTISDGVYEIGTALNGSMRLDVSGASMNDKSNVQIYKSNGTNAQKFIVEKTSGGQYSITSYNSGKAVDLYGASKAAGTNIHQYSKNGSTAQKWIIRNVGDGTLYITSAVSGMPLEVKDGKTANKTNVQVNKATGSQAQKFTFKKVSDSQLKPIANGVYLIHSAKNNSRVIGVEDATRLQQGNIQLQYNAGASFQKFKLTYAGNGYYTIQNVKSKHVLDVKGGSYGNKVNIQQYRSNGTPAQLWLPHKNADGSYTFINAKTSKVLDVAGGSMADSTNIWNYAYNNSIAQKFKLEKTSGSDSTAINYGTWTADSTLSAMFKKAQDYSSNTNYLVLCNITNHRLVLFRWNEGRWISDMNSPISVGKASTPTPTGTFTVYGHWRYFDGDYSESRLTYQCWWSTCFYGSYYFHSVLYNYNSGYPGVLRDGRMNVNVSHGCVRMPLEKAKYLYDHSPIGTKVRVYK